MTLQDKYMLFKKEDVDRLVDYITDAEVLDKDDLLDRLLGIQIHREFFPILEGDVWGPSGLDAYANNIRTTLEVCPNGALPPPSYDYQAALADALTEMSYRWRKGDQKLPD